MTISTISKGASERYSDKKGGERSAFHWHAKRRNDILRKYPKVKKLFQNKPNGFVSIVPLVLVQLAAAFLSQYLPVLAIVFLAATFGTYIFWGLHEALHEISHSNYRFSSTQNQKLLLLKLASIPILGNGYYDYYRWHHLNHHKNQGSQYRNHKLSDDDLMNKSDFDIEVFRDYFAIKSDAESPPRYKPDWVFRNRLLRLLYVGIIIPPYHLIEDAVIYPIVALYEKGTIIVNRILKRKDQKPYTNRLVNSFLIHVSHSWATFVLIYFTMGPLSILYLLLSQIFIQGFLFHPFLVFWVSVHGSPEDTPDSECFPTYSFGGKVASFFFRNGNYHLEHHDFPGLPVHQMHQLREIAPEFYPKTLSTYQLFKIFVTTKKRWVYSCQLH